VSEGNNERRTIGAYRSLGLVANPFLNTRNREGEPLGLALAIQAEANALIGTLDDMVGQSKGRTLWLEKSDQIKGQFHRAALISAEETLIHDEDLNVLHAYVQLFSARIGRVRSVLNVVAERVALRSFDRTLAVLVERVLAEPDSALLEFGEFGASAWASFVAEFEADPIEALAAHFGAFLIFRKMEIEAPLDIRGASLEDEPDETTTDPVEEDEMTERMPEVGPPPAVEEVPDPVVEYVIAYVKKHLSPVIARGLRAYVKRGAGPMGEELKITKAPRKTLKALIDLANMRYRKVVIVLDAFDNWAFMPDDLRIKYITALTELRLRLGDGAMMVFMALPDQAPELEEHFGGGARASWEFPHLAEIVTDKDGLDTDILAAWMERATVPGSTPLSVAEGPLADLVERAEGSLSAFCTMAGAAIEDAAQRGAAVLDETAIAVGVAARAENS